jgi:phycocyanobilin lyase alpha subunit
MEQKIPLPAISSNTNDCGSGEAAYTVEKAIAHLQQTDDPSLRYYAAWWIGRFRVREPVVIASLIEALNDNSDRSPDGGYPLRRNAAKALGKVGNPDVVVPPLIAALSCEDYYVRESVAQSLERLGDRRGVEPLMQLLAGGVKQAQRVPGKPHLVQPYEAIIEALGTLGATEAIQIIEPFLEHFLEKIQCAAARALYQLTGNAIYGERLVLALKGSDLQLRRSAMMDLGSSGYLNGAEAIAQTHAENSLKLVAMKSLLESHLNTIHSFSELTEQSHSLMTLMDRLL